jgi:hypothetical protein
VTPLQMQTYTAAVFGAGSRIGCSAIPPRMRMIVN